MDFLHELAHRSLSAVGETQRPCRKSTGAGLVWSRYENRWDLFDGSAHEAPVLLPPEYRVLALDLRVGLPPQYSWLSGLPEW